MRLCVVVNGAAIWTVFKERHPHPITRESHTAVMTVVISAMQTTNRPNDLRQLNNARGRCCSGD